MRDAHLLLHAVPGVHVLNVVQEVTDGVHVAEVVAVLVHRLEHLVERHADLKRPETHIPQVSSFTVKIRRLNLM